MMHLNRTEAVKENSGLFGIKGGYNKKCNRSTNAISAEAPKAFVGKISDEAKNEIRNKACNQSQLNGPIKILLLQFYGFVIYYDLNKPGNTANHNTHRISEVVCKNHCHCYPKHQVNWSKVICSGPKNFFHVLFKINFFNIKIYRSHVGV